MLAQSSCKGASMGRPLVSVITPTWQRHDLLRETVENVRGQTYPNLEHIVISDGPDDELNAIVHRSMFDAAPTVPINFVELGRNWSGDLRNFGVAPLTVGMLLARGDYQMWLCDDERMTPEHIERLVDLLEATGVDFAYSKVRMHWKGQPPEQGWDIGNGTPSWGQITNFLYRTSLLSRGMPDWGGHPIDWTLVHSWMAADATWVFSDRVTITHRADR